MAVRPLDGLRPRQPPELFPLVQHARRGVAGPRRRRRPAAARGARRPGPADAAGSTRRAAWPPSSPATGSTSAASRNTTPSTASGSRPSRTTARRRCSRSRSVSSSTSCSANGSVLDFLYGDHTFVNPLARHYGMPEPAAGQWTPGATNARTIRARRPAADGGLPDEERPGLRTSPVKRGYWVVRRCSASTSRAPPPDVPESADRRNQARRPDPARTLAASRGSRLRRLPRALRLVRPGLRRLWPVGERRDRGPGGPRRSKPRATFPDGSEGAGLDGLRAYLRARRQSRFRRQPLPQAPGLCPGPHPAAVRRAADRRDAQASSRPRLPVRHLVEAIVTSPQFLTKRATPEL